MYDEKKYAMLDAMDKYGGPFVKALAECIRRADYVNYEKLKSTFSGYFLRYELMSEEERKKK